MSSGGVSKRDPTRIGRSTRTEHSSTYCARVFINEADETLFTDAKTTNRPGLLPLYAVSVARRIYEHGITQCTS